MNLLDGVGVRDRLDGVHNLDTGQLTHGIPPFVQIQIDTDSTSLVHSGFVRSCVGGTIGPRSDFKVMNRPSCRRSKLTLKPCMRSWGARRRSSLLKVAVVLGQPVDAATFFPAISVSAACSFADVKETPVNRWAYLEQDIPEGRVEQVRDRGFLAVVRVGRQERPGLPSQSSANRFAPNGVVGHSRQFGEMNRRQFAQAAHNGVEDGAQDGRPVRVKRLPKLVLAAASGARNRRQTQEDAAIFQIGPTDEVADPAQEHGALGVNEAPIVVGKQSAAGDGAAVDKLAQERPIASGGYH